MGYCWYILYINIVYLESFNLFIRLYTILAWNISWYYTIFSVPNNDIQKFGQGITTKFHTYADECLKYIHANFQVATFNNKKVTREEVELFDKPFEKQAVLKLNKIVQIHSLIPQLFQNIEILVPNDES